MTSRTLEMAGADTGKIETAAELDPSAARPGGPVRLASWRLWIMSAAIFVPFALALFASSAPFAIPEVEVACGQIPPDMRFFTSGDGVLNFLDACGPAGRDSYRNMQLADVFYPAVVGLFLASSLAIVIRRLSPGSNSLPWLATIPLLGSFFDYVENVFAWLAIAAYPSPAITNDVLGLASAAKTTTSWVGGLSLLTCLAILGARAGRSGVVPRG